MDEKEIAKAVINLLEPGIYKTTAQITEELRMEYPLIWNALAQEGEALYGLGCGAIQQPVTRVAQVLLSLHSDSCLCRRSGKEYSLSRPSTL